VQVVSAETGTSQPADIAVHDLVLNFLGTDRVVVLLALDRVLERGVGVIDELAELLGLLTLRRRDAVGMTLHHQLAIGLRDVSRGRPEVDAEELVVRIAVGVELRCP